MNRIPLFRVRMSDAAIAAATETLQSGYVGQGPKVDAFESALQEELHLPRRPVTVNSATTGLELAYRLAGIGEHSTVISTPVTCLATNIPLAHLGADIVWADVNARGVIDPQSVRAIVQDMGDEIAAVVAVDWGGHPCDYRSLRKAAPGIPIIQDAAHSYLTDFSETGMGDYVVWSFQAIKTLTCVDGGAVLVPDRDYDRARLLRWYGLDRGRTSSMRCTQEIDELGWKWHMNDVAAAIGMANMDDARESVHEARTIAHRIAVGAGIASKVLVPAYDPRSSYWLFTVLPQVGYQQKFIDHCDSRGIDASLVHARNDIQPRLGSAHVSPHRPGTDDFCSREVCVPCGWWMEDADVQRVIDAIVDFDYV